MPKKVEELVALSVKKLSTEAGFHAVGGVTGLHLQVAKSGACSWILRIMIGGKRRDMGLGGYPDVTLAQAREKAREARAKIEQGIDPISERAAARSALIAARGSEMTFDEAADKFIEAKSPEWKNGKHAAQWVSTLNTYASPVIGKMQMRDITLAHIIKILEPVWTTKTETATRLRGRLESVIDWATVRGYRHGDNPARWKGHLDKILAKPGKVAKVKHHAALPYSEIGAFMADLRERDGIAARALEFAILTAARSGEVRGARWDEIDLKSRTWTIAAERMKAGKEHRVPLSGAAVKLLEALPRIAEEDHVFPSPRAQKALSDMTLTAVLRRMERSDLTAHGFRSSFRDWAGETTAYPREVIEHALAHQLKDKAEAAYARGTLFEKRARLMEDWARYCDTTQQAGAVVPLLRSTTAA